MEETPEISGDPEGKEVQELIEQDKSTADWMKKKCNEEIESFKQKGVFLIPVKVRNTSVLKGKPPVNRVEFNTSFDFKKVTQILTSQVIDCATKKNFQYINVILFTDGLSPFIFPYVFRKDSRNTLTHWLFINNRLERAMHVVDEFTEIKS